MVVIVLPDWHIKAEEKLDKVIGDIAESNLIDYNFVKDSRVIENSKQSILNALVNIYETVGVEQREKTKKFLEGIKKEQKKTQTKSKLKGAKK